MLISVTAVSASQTNITDDKIIATEDSIYEPLSDINNESSVGDFKELSKLIDETTEGSTLNLTKDYAYCDNTSDFKIVITKPITIEGNNHVLDGNFISEKLTLKSGRIILNNITFKNFNEGAAGGQSNYNVITNCNFINCNGYDGGAINCYDYNEIKNCNFTNCHGYDGGAIFNRFSLKNAVVENCNFNNCSAENYGGAIYVRSYSNDLLINNCMFTDCRASEGGAVYASLVNNSVFRNCTATKRGGAAIYTSAYNSNFTDCNGVCGALCEANEIINCTLENCNDIRTVSHVSIEVSNITSGEKYKIIISLNRTLTNDDNIKVKLNDNIIYPKHDNLDKIIIEEYCFEPGDYTVEFLYEGNYNFTPVNKTVKFSVFENKELEDYNELSAIINETEAGDTITLTKDYGLISTKDAVLTLDKPITIDGAGHSLYFGIYVNCGNVSLKNINFKNIYSHSFQDNIGSSSSNFKNSLYNCSLIDCIGSGGSYITNFDAKGCNFINCYGDLEGGILNGNSINTNFINCSVGKYSKIVNKDSINTTFIDCSGYGNEDNIYGKTTNCTFINIIDKRENFGIYLKIRITENDENEPNDYKNLYISTDSMPDMGYITATFNNNTEKITQDLAIGIFEWDYVRLSSGNYTLIVSYDGDSSTKPGNITKTITIDPPKPKADFNISKNNIQKGTTEEITITFPEDATGDIAINFNDNWIYGKTINNTQVQFTLNTTNTTTGNHTLDIYYHGDDKYRVTHKTFQINVYEIDTRNDFGIYLKIRITENDENEPNDYKDLYISTDPIHDMGYITATFNNSTQQIKQDLQIGKFEWYYPKLACGNYTLIVSYDGDSSTKPGNITKTITIDPPKPKADFNISKNNIQKGTTEEITITFPEDATGDIAINFNDNWIYGKTINNTQVQFTLNTTNTTTGNHTLDIYYHGDDKYRVTHKTFQINVYKDQTKIVASDLTMSYNDGSKYTVTIYGADGKVAKETAVVFKIDGKNVKTVKTDKNGKATLTISQIPGTYKITAQALGITKTKKVTVKQILSLKTVKVKKSAKSLTLTATLSKVKGKYLKSKTIIFKFNGKTYTKKTNSKGVAKVTIQKSVLKKLKVGKKITYQAKYVKDIVKKTVKVQK